MNMIFVTNGKSNQSFWSRERAHVNRGSGFAILCVYKAENQPLYIFGVAQCTNRGDGVMNIFIRFN